MSAEDSEKLAWWRSALLIWPIIVAGLLWVFAAGGLRAEFEAMRVRLDRIETSVDRDHEYLADLREELRVELAHLDLRSRPTAAGRGGH